MTNWKSKGNPFLEFTEELTQAWIEEGFSFSQAKEWLNIGFQTTDFGLARWLRDSKKVDANWVLNDGNYGDLKKEYLTQKSSLEEYLITQILLILDAWRDKSVGEEKNDIRQIIRELADDSDDSETKLEQYQNVVNLLTKYPSFTSVKLSNYLTQWKVLLKEEEFKPKEPQEDEDGNIIPPWLFDEKLETKPKSPKPKITKPVKPPLPKHTGPHIKCSLCEKRKFYSKAEFIQAHGINKLEPSCWVYTKIQPNKQELVFFYKWLCKFCKHEQHTNKCRYYSPPVQPVIPPEIFDWEDYWKWWFGVLTLDWDSKRFFGKY